MTQERAKTAVGLLHPGEMGAAIGRALRACGTPVLWASDGRSAESTRRAGEAGLADAGTVAELARASDVILSVCPPHAAADVARSVAGFDGLYVDANAVSPATARRVAGIVERVGARFVDGGIVGPPPSPDVPTRLYLSGPAAGEVAGLFEGTGVETPIVSDRIGAASAVKMAYAAWSKGTAAMLLAIRALAREEEVEGVLLAEWRDSIPELERRCLHAARSAARKGWRWVGEMEEIAATLADAGLPAGFHEAAAEVFRRAPRLQTAEPDAAALELVLAELRSPTGARPAPRTASA